MLTGYFLYNKKIEIGIGWLKKLLPLIMQVLFYSGLIFFSGVICYIFCNQTVGGIVSIISGTIFPVGRGIWWFFTVYIVLFIISPILNSLFDGISKTNFIKYYFIFYVFFYFIPSFISDPIFLCKGG